MSYHYYDGDDRGRSKLKITGLTWEDGWPVIEDFDVCAPVSVERNMQQITKTSPVTYRGGIVFYFAESNGKVSLSLYSLAGQKIKTILSENVNKGEHRIVINNSGLTTGTYMLVFKNGQSVHENMITVW